MSCGLEIKNIPHQIVKGMLVSLKLNRIDNIVLHHMAHPTADVKTVESWHIAKGWTAIGYNYWIAFDGTVYKGRGLNTGAGVEYQNSHIINIGFQGDYHSKSVVMPTAQFNAGIETIIYVMGLLPCNVNIVGHNFFGGSVCPGKFFPLDEIRSGVIDMLDKIAEFERRISKLEKSEVVYNWTKACPEWSQQYVQKALNLGILKGDENGQLGLTDTKIFSLVMDLRHKGIME